LYGSLVAEYVFRQFFHVFPVCVPQVAAL